jgi:hypothetical protein
MSKKGSAAEAAEEDVNRIGASHQDDTEEMEYLLREGEEDLPTHPPATKAEAEQRAEQASAREELEATEEKKDEPLATGDTDTSGSSEGDKEADDVGDAPEGEQAKADADADVTDEAADETGDTGNQIPHARFQEVNQKRKDAIARADAAEAELLALQTLQEEAKKEPATPDFDYDAKEMLYMDAVLEGNQETALALRKEIRAAESADNLRGAEQVAVGADTQSAEMNKFNATTAVLEAEFPVLDTENEGYNEVIVDEILALHTDFMKSGNYSLAQAIDKATRVTAKMHGIDPLGEEKPKSKVKDVDKEAEKNVNKKIDLAKKQPAKMEGKDNPDTPDSSNAMEMSDEEFEGLPESTKRRMRGDYN